MSETIEVTAGFFESLESRSARLWPPLDVGLRRDRWLLAMVIVGMAIPLVLHFLGDLALPSFMASIASLALQAVGLSLLVYRQVRDAVPDFIDADRKFAVDMDVHFHRRGELLDWLDTFPREKVASKLAYVDARLENFRSRYALLFGAVDKLGVFPVLVGAFVQYQAMQSFSFVVLLMGIALTIFFAMALWLSRFRLQLESYARLLRASLDRAEVVNARESEASRASPETAERQS